MLCGMWNNKAHENQLLVQMHYARKVKKVIMNKRGAAFVRCVGHRVQLRMCVLCIVVRARQEQHD